MLTSLMWQLMWSIFSNSLLTGSDGGHVTNSHAPDTRPIPLFQAPHKFGWKLSFPAVWSEATGLSDIKGEAVHAPQPAVSGASQVWLETKISSGLERSDKIERLRVRPCTGRARSSRCICAGVRIHVLQRFGAERQKPKGTYLSSPPDDGRHVLP